MQSFRLLSRPLIRGWTFGSFDNQTGARVLLCLAWLAETGLGPSLGYS